MTLPIPVPARLVGSLGPIKRDLHPPPSWFLYLGASEVNLAFDLIIRLIQEVNALGLSGATGSLQAAYNNSPPTGPTVIQLDVNRESVIFSDTVAGLGIPLLGVKNNSGSINYGLQADGYLLPDLPTAIQSQSNAAVQLYSRAVSPAPAFILTGESPYTAGSDVYLLMKENATSAFGLLTGSRSLLFFDHAASTVKWGLSVEAGAIRLVTDDVAGRDFLPAADSKGRLGADASKWNGAFSAFYAGKKQSMSFAPILEIDCEAGNVVEIPVTSAITSFTFVHPHDGLTMTLIFRQNAGGTGKITGPLDSDYQTIDGKHLALTPIANAVDVSVWQYLNSLAIWVEISRSFQKPADQRITEQSISGGLTELISATSARRQVFEGTLASAHEIRLGGFAWEREGDDFEIIFSDVTGVTTSPTNTLTITTDGGATVLKLFDLAATLRGRIVAYYTGSAWKISVGNSVLYL